MSRRRLSIHGERGRWLAEVEGRWLAVLHSTARVGATGYHDPMPGAKLDGTRYTEFVAALRACPLAVLQKTDPATRARLGYVGVFHFTDLRVADDGAVSLTFTGRYADPA